MAGAGKGVEYFTTDTESLIKISSSKTNSPADYNSKDNSHYDRWFVVQTVDDDKPLSKLSPFAVDKGIK